MYCPEMLTAVYIDFFLTIWPSKNGEKEYLAKCSSPQFGQKCFWNTQGAPVNMYYTIHQGNSRK